METIFLSTLSIIALMLLTSILKGAPYVPTLSRELKIILEATQPKPGMKAVDLGAGDGRIVIAMAEKGAEAHGYEINPILVAIGKYQIRRRGLQSKAHMHLGSFWSKNLSEYDIVTIFGIGRIMRELETKLQKELKTGAVVASNAFEFPNWPGQKNESVFIYTK